MTVTSTDVQRQPCIACGADTVRFQRRSRAGHTTLECRTCRLVFVGDAPPIPDSNDSEMPYDDYDAARRGDTDLRNRVLDELTRLAPAGPQGDVRLFDVGAGTGEFLDKARTRGFAISGNDYSAHAVDYCKHRYGLSLNTMPLAEQRPASVDIVTMWCVLAHVEDADEFLASAFRMLRPGGVLFLRTPRRCGIDRLGRIAETVSLGRLDHVSERRVNLLHRQLYGEASLDAQLRSNGFVDRRMQAVAHYPFTTATYTQGVGTNRSLGWAGSMVDALIAREWMFRNALLVYARRPFED